MITSFKVFKKIFFTFLFGICLMSSLWSSSSVAKDHGSSFTLTIAHINDNHAHIEATNTKLKLDGLEVSAAVGGLPRIVAKVKDLREHEKHLLFLHAGDVFRGTLYFTQFKGLADLWFFNEAELDAFVPGNHEFDLGNRELTNFASLATFPILGANIELPQSAPLAPHLKPYIIKNFDGERVAVIGLTTLETPHISLPDQGTVFHSAEKTALHFVDELKREGINKIIVLSHLDFDEDKILARAVPEIDVIVGGHSHTLLGKLRQYGLFTFESYPTVIKGKNKNQTLIVQAGDNAQFLGQLNVTFDPQGRITDYSGSPLVLLDSAIEKKAGKLTAEEKNRLLKAIDQDEKLEVVEEDADSKNKLAALSQSIKRLEKTIIGTATQDLKRKTSPGFGEIASDAFLSQVKSQGVQAALVNNSGVRADLAKGPISYARAYEIYPFENTLVILTLTGQEIKDCLEEGIGRQLDKKRSPPYLFVSGMSLAINPHNPKNERITDLKIDSQPVEPNKTYKLVTNNYLARGGSGFTALKTASGGQKDTGVTDAEALVAYVKKMKTLSPVKEARVVINKN